MGYVDLNTIHDPATGTTPPVAWGDQIRANFEYVVDPPRAKVHGLATTCGNGSWQTLDAATEDYDTDGIHTGTNDNLVIVTAGTYDVYLRVAWDTGTTGNRAIGVLLNGTTRSTIDRGHTVTSDGGLGMVQSGGTTLSLAVGDSLVAQGRPDGQIADGTAVEFRVRWIGR